MSIGENILGDAFDAFQSVMDNAFASFAQKQIIWARKGVTLNRFNEDTEVPPTNIYLPALLNYNYMRTWPSTSQTESGENDGQSMQVLLYKKYLVENNYITPQGYLDFDPGYDFFIIDGLKYKPSGDTSVSQMHDNDLLYSVILHRINPQTGNPPR